MKKFVKKPGRSQVYHLQNNAIHQARAKLEKQGVIRQNESLGMVRWIAGQMNGGKLSISSLSLTQRSELIERLIEMGAQVRNPHIYDSDLAAERGARQEQTKKEPRKVLILSRVHEEQFRMLDALAAKVNWHTPDGYKRFCWKLIDSPRPRNSKEVTTLRLALESMAAKAAPALEPQKPGYPQNSSSPPSD